MKTFSLLSLISFLLTLLALAQLAEANEGALSCNGFPDQQFNERLGKENGSLIQAIRCKDLQTALRLSQIMQREIAMEIQKGVSTTEYGECYTDRKCTTRASQTTPTKDMCKAADGKSWKRTNPTEGTCETI